jgi:hypothetical protein
MSDAENNNVEGFGYWSALLEKAESIYRRNER